MKAGPFARSSNGPKTSTIPVPDFNRHDDSQNNITTLPTITMSHPTPLNPFTRLPSELLPTTSQFYIRPTLVQTHNTREPPRLHQVNKSFASLVRPWKMQVAHAQVDYYGGFIE